MIFSLHSHLSPLSSHSLLPSSFSSCFPQCLQTFFPFPCLVPSGFPPPSIPQPRFSVSLSLSPVHAHTTGATSGPYWTETLLIKQRKGPGKPGADMDHLNAQAEPQKSRYPGGVLLFTYINCAPSLLSGEHFTSYTNKRLCRLS